MNHHLRNLQTLADLSKLLLFMIIFYIVALSATFLVVSLFLFGFKLSKRGKPSYFEVTIRMAILTTNLSISVGYLCKKEAIIYPWNLILRAFSTTSSNGLLYPVRCYSKVSVKLHLLLASEIPKSSAKLRGSTFSTTIRMLRYHRI